MNRITFALLAVIALSLAACNLGRRQQPKEPIADEAVPIAQVAKQEAKPVEPPAKKLIEAEPPSPPAKTPTEKKAEPQKKVDDIPPQVEKKRKPVTAESLNLNLPVARDFKPTLVASQGRTKVELIDGKIGTMVYKSRTVAGLKSYSSDEPLLVLKIRITETSGVGPIKYAPWHSAQVRTKSAIYSPTMVDEFGKRYSAWESSVACWPSDGIEKPTPIMAAGSITDIVAVGTPNWLAEELDISLPGASLGENGDFKFKISRKFFEPEAIRKASIDEKIKKAITSEEARLDRVERERLAAIEAKQIAEAKAEEERIASEKRAADAVKELAGRQAQIGSVKITLLGSESGTVNLIDEITRRPGVSKGESLTIKVRLTNLTETKILYYNPWKANQFSVKDAAILRDEFGNSYRNIYYTFGLRADGQLTKRTRIDPGESIEDVLIFDPPIAKAKEFRLTLPGANLNNSGEATLTFSRSLISFK